MLNFHANIIQQTEGAEEELGEVVNVLLLELLSVWARYEEHTLGIVDPPLPSPRKNLSVSPVPPGAGAASSPKPKSGKKTATTTTTTTGYEFISPSNSTSSLDNLVPITGQSPPSLLIIDPVELMARAPSVAALLHAGLPLALRLLQNPDSTVAGTVVPALTRLLATVKRQQWRKGQIEGLAGELFDSLLLVI